MLFQYQRERAVRIDSAYDDEQLYKSKTKDDAPYAKTFFELGKKLQLKKLLFSHLEGYKVKTELDKSLLSGIFTLEQDMAEI